MSDAAAFRAIAFMHVGAALLFVGTFLKQPSVLAFLGVAGASAFAGFYWQEANDAEVAALGTDEEEE